MMNQEQWRPEIGDTVRIRSLNGRAGVVDGIEGSGDDAVYLVGTMMSLSTGPSGEVRQLNDPPIRCTLDDLEP
jgi:hypothetical protein